MNLISSPVRPVRFFTLTFLLSWLIWIPLVLSHFEIGPLHIPEGTSNIVRLLGVLMPATSALILTSRHGGREAMKMLFSRLTLWRVAPKWWIIAVVVHPLLLGFAALLVNFFGESPAIKPLQSMSFGAFLVNAILLLLATLGEEIGWRGVALPALQREHSAWKASTVLGFLWAAWHIPFWLLLDTVQRYGMFYLLLNFLFVFPLTFYITWFFNHGKSSILLAVVFHVTFNIVNTILLPVTIHLQGFAILVMLEWMIAFLILPDLNAKGKLPLQGNHRVKA